jgi:hypothetical protein
MVEVRKFSHIRRGNGFKCELTCTTNYPPLDNDPDVTGMVAQFLQNVNKMSVKSVFIKGLTLLIILIKSYSLPNRKRISRNNEGAIFEIAEFPFYVVDIIFG